MASALFDAPPSRAAITAALYYGLSSMGAQFMNKVKGRNRRKKREREKIERKNEREEEKKEFFRLFFDLNLDVLTSQKTKKKNTQALFAYHGFDAPWLIALAQMSLLAPACAAAAGLKKWCPATARAVAPLAALNAVSFHFFVLSLVGFS